jgi:hypothetical protein
MMRRSAVRCKAGEAHGVGRNLYLPRDCADPTKTSTKTYVGDEFGGGETAAKLLISG